MIKFRRILGVITLASLGFAGLLATEPTAKASDDCKNVKFKVKNSHKSNRAIKLLKVEFFDKGDGKWRTEDLANLDCAQGETCTTKGDNLTDVEAEKITKIRFQYRYKEADGDWSKPVESKIKDVQGDSTCNANKTYGPFTIAG